MVTVWAPVVIDARLQHNLTSSGGSQHQELNWQVLVNHAIINILMDVDGTTLQTMLTGATAPCQKLWVKRHKSDFIKDATLIIMMYTSA
mgnify:CR=1 FL=1